MQQLKLDGIGPVDNRPSTAEAPTIVKIHPFRKIAVILEPIMQFGCPSRLKFSKEIVTKFILLF